MCLQAKQIDAFDVYDLVLTSNLCCSIQGMKGVRCVGLVDGSEIDQTKGTQFTVYIQFGGGRVGGGGQVVLKRIH